MCRELRSGHKINKNKIDSMLFGVSLLVVFFFPFRLLLLLLLMLLLLLALWEQGYSARPGDGRPATHS